MLTSIVGVVILLGGLIFFHELGHYTVAKLFGVTVEVFSLGFGKKLFRRKIGETEYCLSLFPLGGYVKLMGDDPYKGVPASDAHRAFSTQKLYKRFLIVAAGPMANLLLAYVLFTGVFWAGQPMAGTRLGTVTVGSPAWEAGLRPRDRVIEVAGEKILTWNDLEESLKKREGQKLDLRIERGNTELRIPVTVGRVRAKNPYGEDEEVGGIKGIGLSPLESAVGISDPKSPAFKAGLRTGDVITKIDSRSIVLYEEINEGLTSAWVADKPLVVTVKRKTGPEGKETLAEQSFTVVLPALPAPDKLSALGLGEVLGLYPTELFVYKVTTDSPAEKGGMLMGDRIVKVGDRPVYNFEAIVDQVQEAGGREKPTEVTVERAGEKVVLNLKPVETTVEDPLTHQTNKKFMIGFAPRTAYYEPELVKLQIRDPLKLIPHAVAETNLLAKRMLISLVKLVSGKISVKNLGGPVLIASVAGKSLDAGIIPFLQMMALISINLFLLNLFPIPVLDGGHLLFFAIEAIKGKPVSIRTMEIANQVGMVFILMLVGLTLFNDISRIVAH